MVTVSPGFVDGHVHFRDPGQTQKEDVLTGAAAAAAGGYATVICMANTVPTCDTPEIIHYVTDKAKDCPGFAGRRGHEGPEGRGNDRF